MRRLRLWLFTLLLVLTACTSEKKSEPFSFIVLDDIHFAQQEDYLSDKDLDQRTKRTIEQSRATFIPWAVLTVKTTDLEGYCLLISSRSVMADITSPTDRAWIQILFPLKGMGGKFKASLLSNHWLFVIRNIGRKKNKINVHARL